ncbi:solute carrier organic anion transporter family member 3A1 isoform X1 [Macrobrachium rosenbergii]|uniref:solute carrier organic anion transporter family member 3A1 isoform X1 n=1 Tax=Macrobrachium rosenbergii TaxID=79674 RepID=UPI0034D699F3
MASSRTGSSEPCDAYHRSGLYSHYETKDDLSARMSGCPGASGGTAPIPGTTSAAKPTTRNNSTCSTSSRTRHSSNNSMRGCPAMTRNNSTASNSSNHSLSGAAAAIALGGAGGRVGTATSAAGGSAAIGLLVEGNTVGELEETSGLEVEPSLMETSTATTSTVDSTAELVHGSRGVSYNTTTTTTTTTTTSTTNPNSAPAVDSNDCGLFSFRPAFLQRLANIKIFVFLLSILVTVQQALASGYLNSVITTIEKRYEIPSSLTGVISSMYEIGNVITVIFVSYLGSKRRIPVWIGVGCCVMGVGSILFVMPQLISDRWSIELETTNSTDSSANICRNARVRDDTSERLSEYGFGTLPDLSKGVPLGSHNSIQYGKPDNCIKGSRSNVMPVLFFMLAQLLLGAGGSPLFTLGTTYIDDHVKRESSSMYIGIIYTMVAFGPVLGFLLGAYLISFYVDTFFVDTSVMQADHKHARWIGMWWGGFLLCGLLLIFISIPFFMFPKMLKKEKEKVRMEEKTKEFQKGHRRTKSQTSTCSRHSTLSTKRVYGKDVRDIPLSMLKLLVNPIYVMTCLGACMELMIVSGFIVFLPKYLETQFFLSNVQASIFTGGIAIPGACIGIFLGGYLLKRFSLRPKGAIQMVMVFNLIGLSFYGLLFVLGCDNVKMAGTTSPYFNTSMAHSVANSPGQLDNGGSFQVNLTAWCNTGCSCSSSLVEPVCGNNGLTYFSPCHAGCTSYSPQHKFANCTCIRGEGNQSSPFHSSSSLSPEGAGFSEVTAVPVATAGPCYIPCNTIMPFMILLFFMCTVVAISQMPLLMIVLRSVDEEERSFALGVQFVIFRLIAYIPAPIMFGSVIDSTCLMWKSSCGEKGGRCLIYDIEMFRYRYVGICTAIKIISAAIFVFDWLLIRWKYKLDMEGTMTVGDIVNSLMSVDKDHEADNLAEESVWLPELQGSQPPAGHQTNLMNTSTTTAAHHYHHRRNGSLINRQQLPSHGSGHKRSQSGSYVPSRPWAGLYQHRRSHSSSGYQHLPLPPGPPPTGILATQPGHQRRASSGQQVTFRGLAEDPTDLTGVKVVVQGNTSCGSEEDLAIKV